MGSSSEASIAYKSDEEIMNQVAAIRVTGNGNLIDAESLSVVVEDILKHTAPIVGSFLPGTQAPVINVDDITPSANFSSPFCILKQISCKMDCNAPGEVNAHETTLSILRMLSDYSWDARAVMTLAAFAFGFGEFWFLVQLQSSDQLAKSVASLKQIPVLVGRIQFQKHQQAFTELINLIKGTMEVIRSIFELEKLPNYGRENVPALSNALDHIPIYVYWVIRTVAGCSTQMTRITGDEQQAVDDLSSLAYNLDHNLNNLKMQLNICKQQIEATETEAYQILENQFQTHATITEVIKALCYGKSNMQLLIDGSTEVNFDILKHKYVLLLISGPDVSENDLLTLKQLHQEIGNRGKIVWIPIVGQATIDMERKFRSHGSEVPLYIVHKFSPIPGIKFIKEEWHFRHEALVVVINPKVRVEQCILVEQIKDINSFPCFRKKKIDVLLDGISRCACHCLCVHVRT
ncbi:hypothetical protein I3843_01G183300 [Carya illinoinensis]|nr:hypothetical protein I3760_01G188100 [Carya illinoinensis]KAG7996886.1 hypothetical protein I3843_01G183300 [Carya illinoinensis]